MDNYFSHPNFEQKHHWMKNQIIYMKKDWNSIFESLKATIKFENRWYINDNSESNSFLSIKKQQNEALRMKNDSILLNFEFCF
jgi:hypothetical protein